MKKFNRVLAMLLALVMVLAILPISAIADTWLNVEAEKETNGNETTTDVTVTVDPKALLSYLQDGDLKGLLKGISATGGLGSIMTKEELLAIIPEEQLIDLAKAIVADIDAKALLECLDADALLACVDKAGLVNLLKGIDLKKYVKDVDLLMDYINDEDLEKAVAHINTTELIKDYSSQLMDLALGLTPAKLFEIVKIDSAVKLDGVDVKAAANLTYIKDEIGYTILATTYVNKTALDVYVDANVDRFSATIPAYVNKTELSGLFGSVKDKLADYMNAANAEAIVRKAIDDGVLSMDVILPYVNGDTIDMDALVASDELESLYDELLTGYGNISAAFDVKVLLFGNNTLAPLFPNLADLIAANVLNVEDLLNNEIIKLDELITAKVIDVDALATQYGYNNLVKLDVIKGQITAALSANVLTADKLVACLKDYTAAVKAIGVSAAINAIPGGFATVIDYVTNLNAILDIVGVETIAIKMVKDRTITDIIDVVGVVKAIGPAAVVSKVDVMQLIKVIYESGAIQELIGMLDFDEYLVKAFNILASLQKTITEIELDGVVITERNESGYIKLLPAELIDAIENLIPSLNELANLDDSGKLFEATFAFSYLNEEGVEQTKNYNFTFVLTAGTDTIRAAAAKLSVLMDKIGSVEFVGGELVADITVPSEFASVLRIALEKMADSNDPEFNALKDKVLAVYKASPDDFIAFAEGLTFEEVVAVLNAVDPALFGKVYNKVLASRYAEVLLAYIERVTGYDLSDNLEAQNLINTIAEIPTFEVFVEKLESVTGIEITDRLPAKVNGYLDHTVFDVIDKLADRYGYDFNLYKLLKNAAASSDPLAYLYTAFVNKFENSSAIYNLVKGKALKVANRLMATSYGKQLADNCLMDFYHGNSTFVFDRSITFDAKIILEKGLKKALGLLDNYAPSVATKLNGYVADILDILFAEDATVTTGFDVTVHVNNIYRVDFVNEHGSTFLTTLLPVGTNISKMVDYSDVEGFLGWVDEKTGETVTVMPAKDVVLKASFQSEIVIPEYTVTIIPVDAEGNLISGETKTVVVAGNIPLSVYLSNFNDAAKELYPALSDEDALLGYFYSHTWKDGSIFGDDFYATDNFDVYVTITKNKLATAIVIDGLVEGTDYKHDFENGVLTLTLNKDWDVIIEAKNLSVLNFNFDKNLFSTELFENLNTVILTAEGTDVQKVTLNRAMLTQLFGAADNKDTIGLSYNPTPDVPKAGYEGEKFYEFNFTFDGGAESIGKFDAGAIVEITLPFEGLDTDDSKTFVTIVDEETGELKEAGDVLVAGSGVTVVNGTVSFNAPHFSIFTIVNKYRVKIDTIGRVDPDLNKTLPNFGVIVTLKRDTAEAPYQDFYACGESVKFTVAEENVPSGLKFLKMVKVETINGEQEEITPLEGTAPNSFTMPAAAIKVAPYFEVLTYTVYYYVAGEGNYKLDKVETYDYFTDYTGEETSNFDDRIAALKDYLRGVAPTAGNNIPNCYWSNANTIGAKLFKDSIHLFWVNSNDKITVEFLDDNGAPVTSFERTINEWKDFFFEDLQKVIKANGGTYYGYIWKNSTDGNKEFTAYTFEDFLQTAIQKGNKLTFTGEKVEREYEIFIEGDVTVNVEKDPETGEVIVTVIGNRVGYTAIFNVYYTIGGEIVERYLENGKGGDSFKMPASNITIEVTGYTADSIIYTDKDGNEVTGAYNDVNKIVITVPAGSTLHTNMMPDGNIGKLSTAPAGLVLVSAERTEDGSLVLTYQYTLTETVDEQAFIAQVQSFIKTSEYGVVTYVVNGVEYATMAEAMANLPKRASVVEWAQVSPNVMIAILEYQTLSVWAIISIILGVLLLLAIITLIYVLHVSDKIGTSWLTKTCVAIVSVFFGFCMLLAKIALKVLNFMGIKDEDILEELPAEPVDDIPVVLIDPATLTAEEGDDVEEVLGEESEEAPAEEVTEEAPVEEVTEEAPAEEAVVEETPVDDAIPVEVIDETATEEAPAEEATEEAPVEEATEEAPAEEATEEAPAEEATEEAPAEEATEEAPAEEATEEAPAEEATEEAPAEEATEEAPVEEATEEAPAEEATEETAEEAVEEEKKDE